MLSFTQVDYDNMVAYVTGVQASGLNPAIVTQVNAAFSKALKACQLFYADKNVPWALIVPDYVYDSAISHILEESAFVMVNKGVAMVAKTDNLPILSFDTPLTFREMKHDLNAWSLPLIAFDPESGVSAEYPNRHRLASEAGAPLYHFSGFIGDSVICSLSLSIYENYARIDDVATIPEYQKRGYATQLMIEALQYVRQLNIGTCFLEASTDGLQLYKRIGFNELFINLHMEQLPK